MKRSAISCQMKKIFYFRKHLRIIEEFHELCEIVENVSTKKEVTNCQKSREKLSKKTTKFELFFETSLMSFVNSRVKQKNFLRHFRLCMIKNFSQTSNLDQSLSQFFFSQRQIRFQLVSNFV